MSALDTIYRNLWAGMVYGKYNFTMRFPVFEYCLTCDGRYIYWQHFGSSANKCTKPDLEWIIRVLFQTTPEKFAATYTCDYPEQINAFLDDYCKQKGIE